MPSFLRWIYVVGAAYRLLAQILWFLYTLLTIPKPDYILVQTPPAIPALLIAIIAARFRKSKLAFDWHNYGYTILQVNRPNAGFLVPWYRR